jgi:hypothetical protein
MYIVKAGRWNSVDLLLSAQGAPVRCCSVCASTDLCASSETALDATTNRRYSVVRCMGCGYDLLEPIVTAVAAAS